MQEYLTPEQVAKHLAVSTKTLEYWRYKDHGPPYVKIRRSIRYPLDDLIDFLENHTT